MRVVTGPTAALAGVPAGLQAHGAWSGRRQLFVRFAAEAETATMYTPDALRNELARCVARASYHSISLCGRDPLANLEYLQALFAGGALPLPVMLDIDGQRPEALAPLLPHLALVQVTVDGAMAEPAIERAMQSLAAAGQGPTPAALVLCPDERMSDAQLLRVVEQAHATAPGACLVIHPHPSQPLDRDRRWITLMERAAALHGDLRLALRIPSPTGMR